MRFLLSTGSLYPHSLDRCFALAQQAGFDGIELMIDRREETRQPDRLCSLASRYRLPILAVHAPLEHHAIAGWPNDTPSRVRLSVELAETLAAPVVVHHLPQPFAVHWVALGGSRWPLIVPGRDPYTAWLLEDYPALQARTRVALCVENLPALRILGWRINPGRWNTPEAIGRFPHLTLDTTHLGTWGLDPTAVYERLRGCVRHVHLSNFDGHEHRRPEAGCLHLDRLLARLAGDGFDGAVTLELLPDALSAGEGDEAVGRSLAGSLAYCRKAAATGSS